MTDRSKVWGASTETSLCAHRGASPYVGVKRNRVGYAQHRRHPTHAQTNKRPSIQSSTSTTTQRQPSLPLVRTTSHRSRPPNRIRPQPRRQHRHQQHGASLQTLQRTTRTTIQSPTRRTHQSKTRTSTPQSTPSHTSIRNRRHTVF